MKKSLNSRSVGKSFTPTRYFVIGLVARFFEVLKYVHINIFCHTRKSVDTAIVNLTVGTYEGKHRPGTRRKLINLREERQNGVRP